MNRDQQEAQKRKSAPSSSAANSAESSDDERRQLEEAMSATGNDDGGDGQTEAKVFRRAPPSSSSSSTSSTSSSSLDAEDGALTARYDDGQCALSEVTAVAAVWRPVLDQPIIDGVRKWLSDGDRVHYRLVGSVFASSPQLPSRVRISVTIKPAASFGFGTSGDAAILVCVYSQQGRLIGKVRSTKVRLVADMKRVFAQLCMRHVQQLILFTDYTFDDEARFQTALAAARIDIPHRPHSFAVHLANALTNLSYGAISVRFAHIRLWPYQSAQQADSAISGFQREFLQLFLARSSGHLRRLDLQADLPLLAPFAAAVGQCQRLRRLRLACHEGEEAGTEMEAVCLALGACNKLASVWLLDDYEFMCVQESWPSAHSVGMMAAHFDSIANCLPVTLVQAAKSLSIADFSEGGAYAVRMVKRLVDQMAGDRVMIKLGAVAVPRSPWHWQQYYTELFKLVHRRSADHPATIVLIGARLNGPTPPEVKAMMGDARFEALFSELVTARQSHDELASLLIYDAQVQCEAHLVAEYIFNNGSRLVLVDTRCRQCLGLYP